MGKGINFRILFTIFVASGHLFANAQKVNLNQDGSAWLKFGGNLQIWGRYTEFNSGTMLRNNSVAGAPDLVIRRLRIQALGMVTPKVFMHIQLGQNNVDFKNGSPNIAPLALFDCLSEYHFSDNLHIGGGLTGWGAGVNRYSAQSSSSQLTLDAPIYQQYNPSGIYGNRGISAYAKGTVKSINYVVAVTNPYVYTNSITASTNANPKGNNLQYLSRVEYQFWEKESIAEPFTKATYLGKKDVFNVALGYMHQKDAMARLNGTDTSLSNMEILGADVFMEKKLNENGRAITIYTAYTNMNFGTNYLRTIATPNPATQGAGNGFFGIGTGSVLYAQIGYLFDKSDKNDHRIQPYISVEMGDFEALKTPMNMYDAGVNFYLQDKLGPKFTLGYQNRPVYTSNASGLMEQTERKGMYTLQFQVNI